MTPNRLAQTEFTLANADRLWRLEMKRQFGSDGVLLFGYGPEARGDVGSPLRQTHESRQRAITEWRHERRPQL